jgi:hypothetical protein
MLSSQPDPRRILTYGHDSVLLETRRLLLEQGGFAGDTASTLQEFVARVAETQPPYGLYVLCHTVPLAERHAIAADALRANTAVYQPLRSRPPTSSLKCLSCSLVARDFV